MKILSSFLLIAIVPLLLCRPFPAHAASAKQWYRVRTDHFTLYSAADMEDVVHKAWELERMAEVITLWGLGTSEEARQRVTMVAIPDKKSWQSHQPVVSGKRQELAGYVVEIPFGFWIGYAEYDSRGLAVAHHEYSHTLISDRFRTAPLCLNEGLAEYLSTFAAEGSKVSFGDELPWHRQTVHNLPLFSMDGLFSIDATSASYRSREQSQRVFYAQSWALVHYLMMKKSNSLFRFTDAIVKGKSPRAAFAAVYPTEDWAQLPMQLITYAKSGRLKGREISFRGSFEALAIEADPVSQAEVNAQLALWRSMTMGVDEEGTHELLADARSDPEAAPLAMAVEGLIAMRKMRIGEAVDAFEAVSTAPHENAMALSIAGTCLLQLGQSFFTGEKDSLAKVSLGLLTRSLAVDPNDANALESFNNARGICEEMNARQTEEERREETKANRGNLVAMGKLRAGSLAMQKGEFEAALRWFKAAHDRCDDVEIKGRAKKGMNEALASKSFQEGLKATERNDLEHARECFEKTIKLTETEGLKAKAQKNSEDLLEMIKQQ